MSTAKRMQRRTFFTRTGAGLAGIVLAPGNIEFLASAIRPAAVLAKGEGMDKVNSVVRANVSLTIQRLQNSMILTDAQTKGQLKIVGGFYDLDTGAVDFMKPG